MRHFWLSLLACIPILIYSLSPSYALDVTLAWDANSETDLAGYKIYYGTKSGGPYNGTGSSEGASPVVVPLGSTNLVSPQFTVHGLQNQTYYFVATAYNTEGYESGYSNQVSTSTNQTSTPGNQGSTQGNQGNTTSNQASSSADQTSTPERQVSTSTSAGTAGGGGGGCFIATADFGDNAPQRAIYLSLILLSLIIGLAILAKKFRNGNILRFCSPFGIVKKIL
jgi:hypothetical protein